MRPADRLVGVAVGHSRHGQPRLGANSASHGERCAESRFAVLFIGNSQTDAVADIPEIVEDLSHSVSAKAPPIIGDSAVIGGVGLKELWDDGLAKRKIDEGNYDWVVFAGDHFPRRERRSRCSSSTPACSPPRPKRATRESLLFVTSRRQPITATTTLIMYAANLEMAREAALPYRRRGNGVAEGVGGKARRLDLHFTDRAHPNLDGYYLNRVRHLRRADRSGAPPRLDPYGLPQDDAAFFQSIAWAQYADDRRAEKSSSS